MSFRDKIFDKIRINTGRRRFRGDSGYEEFTIRIRQLQEDRPILANNAIEGGEDPFEYLAKYEYYCILNLDDRPIEIKADNPDEVKVELLKALNRPATTGWEHKLKVRFFWPPTYEEACAEYQRALQMELITKERLRKPTDEFNVDSSSPRFGYQAISKCSVDGREYWGKERGVSSAPDIGLFRASPLRFVSENEICAVIPDTQENRDFLKRLHERTSRIMEAMGKIALAGSEYWDRMLELVNTHNLTPEQAALDVLQQLPKK